MKRITNMDNITPKEIADEEDDQSGVPGTSE